ncbi:MAG: CidA/LrgA family protein [Prevotella sp.]|nr:CidA/LrgA family protein [Prevotella sp.]
MARQFFIIFGCLALGEFIVWATGIKLPSSIIGMLLLTLFLKLGWVKLAWIKRLSELLIANLGFFFVPPGVALMLYLDIIQKELLPIATATLVSTVLVLVVTGHMHQMVIRFERRLMSMDLLHHRGRTGSKKDSKEAEEE